MKPQLLLLVHGVSLVAQVGASRRFAAVDVAELVQKSLPLEKRDGSCVANRHPCLEIGFGDVCCDNDSYCYISNKTGGARCCPLGSDCISDSVCKSEQFFCTQNVTHSGTTTTQTGCCGRTCAQPTQYLCPKDLGGKCCDFDTECRSGGVCIHTQSATTTSTTTGAPTATSRTPEHEGSGGSGGLSDGAKAGIGIGAVIGGALIIAAVVWILVRRRRHRRRASTRQSGSDPQSGSLPGTEAGATTSVTQPRRGRGLTQDYFGPPAVDGPFTERHPASPSAPSPGLGAAVPPQPSKPGDIAAPVEMDSTTASPLPDSPGYGYSEAHPEAPAIQGVFEVQGSEVSSSQPQRLALSLLGQQGPSPSGS